MKQRTVSILTGWGGTFGAGHIQRMACLADYCNRVKGVRTVIAGGTAPAFLPESLHDIFVPDIVPGSSCILRDLRDSDADDMRRLKSAGPVIAIDDCGPGRGLADAAIDLLPNLRFSNHKKNTFIYGYSFSHSLRQLGTRNFEKTIDIALYCGLDPAQDYIRLLLSFMPEKSRIAVLAGRDSYLITNRKSSPLNMAYAETLASAKVLVTHFGITLYEGLAARCGLVCINPSRYHSDLADRAADETGLLNLGTMDRIKPAHARSAIASTIQSSKSGFTDTADITRTIDSCLENVFTLISPYLA